MSKQKTPLSPYQKKLLVFLSVATFFEGYDALALSQILPNFRQEMDLSIEQGGELVTLIRLGAIFSFFLIRQSDRFGRQKILSITIAGYTIFSFLTGLAPNALFFGISQFFARIFLIAELAVCMIYAAEEFPADRRGFAIALIQAFGALGGILCAGVVPFLLELPFGWRSVYFVGGVPLILVAFARRNIKETKRFEGVQAEKPKVSLFEVLNSPYRKRVFQLALIWICFFICTQNAITFWKEFVVAERAFSDKQVGLSITIAAVASMPLVFLATRLHGWLGRKKTAIFLLTMTALGTYFSYTLYSQVGLTIALMIGIFGAGASPPVLNAYTTELFPTSIRSNAFAWSNNFFGRTGFAVSALVIGHAAGVFGFGSTVSLTGLFPFLALGLILWLLPETHGQELEETSVVKT